MDTAKSNGQNNRNFLASLDAKTTAEILVAIADHYDTSVEAIFEEVVNDEAYNLLEYMIEPTRSATSVLMQRYKAQMARANQTQS